MPFDEIVERIIQEALARGEFEHLAGQGKPLDLGNYFQTPQDVRAAYAILKNAGALPREVELLREIAELRKAEACAGQRSCPGSRRQIEKKQLELSLLMERRRAGPPGQSRWTR